MVPQPENKALLLEKFPCKILSLRNLLKVLSRYDLDKTGNTQEETFIKRVENSYHQKSCETFIRNEKFSNH